MNPTSECVSGNQMGSSNCYFLILTDLQVADTISRGSQDPLIPPQISDTPILMNIEFFVEHVKYYLYV